MAEKHLYGTVLLKAKEILDFISNSKTAPGLKEISMNVEISKPTVLKILQTLEYCGFVRSYGTIKKYYLGTIFLKYGDQVAQEFDLVKIATPFLNDLRDKTTEAVNLGIVEDDKVVLLARAKSTNSIHFDLELGGAMDMYSSAMGKAILAHYPDDKLIDYLNKTPLKPKTPNTIVTREDFLNNITEIKKDGYAIDDIENQEGVYCIGFPLIKGNQIFGGFSISAPVFRIDDKKRQEWIEYGLQTERKILSNF
ncbi:IclR family transcriptional regulator [Companilactobacillus musae]|uniref:IclR family transcriptional regulator n=1 Tax=Companilactobacillus musae TaxID=1903258 RepID=UPI000E64F4EC|nr:IclR family transcriptional regulator [Companilactobacillus musae]